MYLEQNIYYLSFLLYFPFTMCLSNKHLKVTRSGISAISTCSVGLQFYADISNVSGNEDFTVNIIPDECCLDEGTDLDCEIMEIIGECNNDITKGSSKTFKLIAPMVDSLNRYGYCTLYLDSKPIEGLRTAMRDPIRIDFDTRLESADTMANLKEVIKPCKRIDEDPLNDCKAVDCEVRYNSKRPYYDRVKKRCVPAPECVSKEDNDEVLYDPKTNNCNELVSNDDIEFLKSINRRPPKDIFVISDNHKINMENATKIEPAFPRAMATSKSSTPKPIPIPVQVINFTSFLNKYCWNFTLLVIIVTMQCLVICFLVYILRKIRRKGDDKEVISKYFNSTHDVSVTTPLIYTSNADTETTDKVFYESSNADAKIKSYKACQNDNDVKTSLSDDILSKCINRRDWSSKTVKSDEIPKESDKNTVDVEKFLEETSRDPRFNVLKLINHSKEYKLDECNDKKDITVESETSNKSKRSYKKMFSKLLKTKESKECNKATSYTDKVNCYSEKELHCHNYNETLTRAVETPVKTNSPKQANFFTVSEPSIEKGAQAVFANNSIEDYLTEKLQLLNAEDLTFSSKTTYGDISGKTSKNNVLDQVCSFFSRKSKSQSDPGTVQDSTHDLEFLHFTKTALHDSSSDNE